MGLSSFEESSSYSKYCCPSVDRSLTICLIELSNTPFKSNSRFSHTPDWADGIDIWSSNLNSTKNENTRRRLDFHRDLGLYLPRHEKPNSAPISLKGLQINSKLPPNHFTPERIQLLLRKQKDLLLETNLSDQQLIIDNNPPPVPRNTFRQSNSIEFNSSSDIRFPIHQITNKSLSPPNTTNSSLNQDTLKTLLKEHLTSLLTRGASTLNANRTLINVSPMDIKQQIRTDSKLTEERYSKIDELIPTQQIKMNQTSPIQFHPKPTFGLTVTPVDFNSQRNFQSVSLEKMAQQRNFNQDNDSSSSSNSRPSTQPVPLSPLTHQFYQPQKIIVRRNFETTNLSSVDINTSNENLNKFSDQTQLIQNNRKLTVNHRSTTKNSLQRTTAPATATTIELLPPIISGKRLHIPLANHRYL